VNKTLQAASYISDVLDSGYNDEANGNTYGTEINQDSQRTPQLQTLTKKI
jgi:hypothetical protein